MPKFRVEYEYAQYESEVFWDELEGEEYVENVPYYIEDVIYLDADDSDDAFDKAYDELNYYDGLSVLSASIVEDDE